MQPIRIGRGKFGTNIIVDFDKRDDDKTNSRILILGNSGQSKSYLLKLILCNILESAKNVIRLDPEHEYVEIAENLGGCFVDLMNGQYIINTLEPNTWDDWENPISYTPNRDNDLLCFIEQYLKADTKDRQRLLEEIKKCIDEERYENPFLNYYYYDMEDIEDLL